MAVPHPIPEPLAQVIAERFRVLSEPMRLRLLDSLRDGESTVGELAARLETSQQNVSKHLGVLASAGLVERRKEGTAVRCRIADASVFALCDLVCGGVSRQIAELQHLIDGTASEASR
ncbi:MAG: metalloregulator ArsR/SmtB family transcription factor [Miltoncostaeaceae bacterium]